MIRAGELQYGFSTAYRLLDHFDRTRHKRFAVGNGSAVNYIVHAHILRRQSLYVRNEQLYAIHMIGKYALCFFFISYASNDLNIIVSRNQSHNNGLAYKPGRSRYENFFIFEIA